MATVLDYATGPPSAASIKRAGHIGAVRYISPARPAIKSWASGKPVHRAEVDDFDAHDLKMSMVWQYGAGDSLEESDIRRGFDGGVADAKAAQAHLDEIRCSGHPVYFAVDFDISTPQWNQVGADYFRGAASVLGKQRVGIYGHSRLAHWAGPENDLIAQVEPGRWLAWITQSWKSRHPDGTPRGRDYAVLFQDEHNVPGPDGVQVDVNLVWHPEWGWRALDDYQRPQDKPNLHRVNRQVNEKFRDLKPQPNWRGDPTFLPMVLEAFGVPIDFLPGWDQWGMGDFNEIWGVMAHHTGANNTSAEYIARNPGLSGGLSSQIQQSRTAPYTATLCGVGIAWHAGKGSYPGLPTNNANPKLIGWEPQSNGTDPWPEGMLDIYHRGVAAILWFLGHNANRCISHWEYSLIAQGKWDPGAGNGVSGALMDMDHFRSKVQHYIDNPPFLEGISTMALDLTKRYTYRTPEAYRDGPAGSGTLVDTWLNTDTHAWVARVNTQAILNRLDGIEAHLKATDNTQTDLAGAITALADAIRS